MGKGNKDKGRIKSPQRNTSKHLKQVEEVADSQNQKLRFSFEHLTSTKNFTAKDCNYQQLQDCLNKLRILSSKTWKEVHQEHRHKGGCEFIDQGSISAPIPKDVVTPDVRIMVFRMSGLAPMAGFRDSKNIYQVVWLDPKFKLYDH